MCFNKEVSISTYIFGMACALYLIYRGITKQQKADFTAGVFLIFIAKMQLIEYFLWKNQKCNFNNKLASYFIMILLYFQMLVQYLLHLYNNKLTPFADKETKKKTLEVIAFTIITIYILVVLQGNFNDICSLKDTGSCRLIWEPFVYLIKNNLLAFIIFIALYFRIYWNANYFELPFLRKNIFLIMFVLAMIYSFIYKFTNPLAIFGGVWCILCVLYGPVSILNY